MILLLATSNQHKLDEAREILEPLGIEVLGLDSLNSSFQEPVEDSDTFEGNARLKAVGYARATGKRTTRGPAPVDRRRPPIALDLNGFRQFRAGAEFARFVENDVGPALFGQL